MGKNCEISYLNPQYMYVQIESQTNTIWESQDYGQSWSAVYNHPQSIKYANLVSTDDYLFAFNRNRARLDRYTFTHSAPSNEGATNESSEGTSNEEQSSTTTSTIIYNTPPLLKRLSTTIENESTLSFTLSLDHSKANSYMIQLLDEDSMITQ